MLEQLNCKAKDTTKKCKSPFNSDSIEGQEYDLNILVPEGNKKKITVCGLPLNLIIKIPHIRDKIQNALDDEVLLSPSMPTYDNDTVIIGGILGMDLIPLFRVFELTHVKGISYFRFSNGYIPVGKMNMNKYVSDVNKVRNIHTERNNDVKIKNKFNCLQDNCTDSVDNNSDSTPKDCNKFLNLSKGNALPKTKYRSAVPNKADVRKAMMCLLTSETPHRYDDDRERIESALLSIESIGIKPNMSSYDEEKIAQFQNNIKLDDERYSVVLPWNHSILDKVPSNFVISKILAKKVANKTHKAGYANEYLQVFDDQLASKIIEPIMIDEKFNPEEYKWVPHHPVIKSDPSATTKVRPVLNCAFKTGHNPSLNDASYGGIDISNNLLGLLNYARTNDYLTMGDIEKAFLQIELTTTFDRNKFCFLLYRNNQYEAYRYSRLIFGYVASPFILNFVIKHHAENNNNDNVKDILCNKMYVDNMIFTHNVTSEAVAVINEVDRVMKTAGFPLREFSSNDGELLKSLNVPPERLNRDSQIKLLGYNYNTVSDTITLRRASRMNRDADTRRQILSAIAEIYDPLGICNPILINGKILLRSIVERNFGWDEKLPCDILSQYVRFCDTVDTCLGKFVLDRKILSVKNQADIKCFVDASKTAYGFVSYVVQENKSNFLFSKLKLNPIPPKTLPTLELLASFLALKCISNILSEKNFNDVTIKNIVLYSDSQVSLAWLLKGSAPRKNIFVNNRLREIQSIKESLSARNIKVTFKFTTGESNISDIITRQNNSSQVTEHLSDWLHGPAWLLSGYQPQGNLGCIPDQYTSVVGTMHQTTPMSRDTETLDVSKYSSYIKLLNVTSKVFYAIAKFKRNAISADEAKIKAFTWIIKSHQTQFYDAVRKCLADRTLPQIPIVHQLNVFVDNNGLLRSQSRADKSLILGYDAKNPVIIHPTSHLAELLIRFAHFKCNHLGIDTTINFLRNAGFWIPRARSTVQRVINKCVACQRYTNRPFKNPVGTALPTDRVNPTIPFAITGIDYTGHFHIKGDREETSKYYILIFTCLVTRAIHMEILCDMATDSFVLAMIRFCNRYGIPRVVYSDNAKTFVSGGNVLSDIFVSSQFQAKFKPYHIQFKTIPIYSPWYGATWERLIKTVKSCIYKTIGRSKLKYFAFLTLISDVEAVMNNRPLTYRSSDNSIEVITPNHFIRLTTDTPSMILTSTEEYPEIEDVEDPDYDPYNKLITSLDIRQQLINKYTNVWLRDYLLSLKRNIALGNENKTAPELQVGQVALMQVPTSTRPFLKLVRIVEHIPSNDGNLRAVKVKMAEGSIKTIAIANLIPLEIGDVNIQEPSLKEAELSSEKVDPLCIRKAEQDNVVSQFECSTNSNRRTPARDAAIRSRSATKEILLHEGEWD